MIATATLHPGEETTVRHARILVVEDERIVARSLRKQLTTLGYEIVGSVPSGEEAIQQAKELRPDLVLMDINLEGEMDGVEAAAAIRTQFQLPVVYLTAYSNNEILERAKITEPFGYILKPYQERELYVVIETALYKHRMDRLQHESEGRLRELLAHIQQALWMVDAKDSKVVYISPGYEKLWGHSCQSLIDNPQSYLEGVHPLDREKVIRADAAMHETGQIDVEFRILRPDESVRWAWVQGYPVRDAQGQFVRFVGIVEDITERKEAVEQLRSIAEHVVDGIITIDEHGTIATFNPAAERIFGYLASEVIKQNVKLLMPEPYHSRHDGYIANYLRTGESKVIGVGREVVGRHKDGSVFPMDISISRIGETDCFTGIVRDITVQKAAQEDQGRLAAIIECSDDAIVSSTLEGIVLTWNHGAERLYGYSAEEMLGRNLSILVIADYEDDHRQIMEKVQMGERIPAYDTKRRRNDGSVIDVSLSVSPILVRKGEVVGVSKIAHDISKVKQLEEQFRQAQKMEAVGQLAAGVAHDFNNLLTIISGYSEILLSTLSPTDPKREALNAIHHAGERAAGLTRQLLAFSRQTVLEPKVLDLNEVVTTTEKLLRRLIGENIILRCLPDPTIHQVKIDPGLLEQVLVNLAVNARDAMPQGGHLSIETRNMELDQAYCSAHPGAKPGKYVQLTTSDTGCGMTPEIKRRIFEPFFTTKDVGRGTGLGLAVVYGIVKQSNAFIDVYTETGIGTTFKLYFPAVEENVVLRAADPIATTVSHGTETVLVVEDEESVRGIALLALRAHGYQVLTAKDGLDAHRIAARHAGKIDLLLTDVVMPGMSGRELSESLSPNFPHMKTLFMSGYTNDAVIRHGLVQEKIAFLQKPFLPLALARKVRAVLDEK